MPVARAAAAPHASARKPSRWRLGVLVHKYSKYGAAASVRLLKKWGSERGKKTSSVALPWVQSCLRQHLAQAHTALSQPETSGCSQLGEGKNPERLKLTYMLIREHQDWKYQGRL